MVMIRTCTTQSVETGLTDGDEGHEEDLDTGAHQCSQQQCVARRSEHIPMHQLPSRLLYCFILTDTHIVSS